MKRLGLTLALLVVQPVWAAEPSPQQQLKAAQQQLDATKAQQSDLTANDRKLESELTSLRQKLVGATSEADRLSGDLAETEQNLSDLEGTAARRNTQLASQRAQMAELVAILQRLALTPPAAQLMSQTPPLDRLRSNLQIKAILPQLKQRSDELAATVADMRLLRDKLEKQRSRVREQQKRLSNQQDELKKLVTERSKLQESNRARNAALRARADKLAEQAKDLRELVEKTERASAAAAAAATASPPLSAKTLPAGAAKRLPVSAPAVTRFGERDALGNISKGLILRPRPGAPIAAPAAGRVAFAGPFRGYGRVVILEHPGNFHTVMAGMGAISVDVGDDVAAGEALGNLSDYREPIPELYFEVRHKGTPVDPLGELAGRLTQ